MIKAFTLTLRRIISKSPLRNERFRNRAVFGLIGMIAIYIAIPNPDLQERVSWSSAFYDQNGKLLRLTLSSDEKYRIKTDQNDIDPELIEATLLYEDRFFYLHPGVNPVSLFKAFYTTYVAKTRKVGASTITMQLARTAYGIKTDSIFGKIIQILRAFQIELHLSKKEILEYYFSLAPYGGNIEGVGAASLIYFRKRPGDLTTAQAIALSVIPQNPVDLRPSRGERNRNANERWTEAAVALARTWIETHHLKNSNLIADIRHLTVSGRSGLPFEAPHFVQNLLDRDNDLSSRGHIETTLDLTEQHLIERSIDSFVEAHRSEGITNGAAILVNARDMSVEALVGSADFFDREISGQVDGSRARRSPGSTLKPFVYALALDQGLIHSQTVLKDAPIGFGAYSPENYDGKFSGPVHAGEALIKSRNIPAAFLTSRLKEPDFYEWLNRAGIQEMKSRDYYGLSIILGGAEMTMQEIAELYALLANSGTFQKLRFIRDEPLHSHGTLLSGEAAWITRKMLENNPSPLSGNYVRWSVRRFPVAWKSGTSQGFKDGWAAAIVGSHVVIVWIGNFSGVGNPAFTGRTGAGKLLFRIIDALRTTHALNFSIETKTELNIKTIDVCAASGGIPGPHCPSTIKAYFIPGVSPIEPDTVFREILIRRDSGLRACNPFESNGIKQVYEFWPSDLLKIFHEAGIPRKSPPPYAPDCNETFSSGNPPKITSPLTNVTYRFSLKHRKLEIPLEAVTDGSVTELHWFVNTTCIGSAKPSIPFFWNATPGKYLIQVVDTEGRSDSREVTVEADR